MSEFKPLELDIGICEDPFDDEDFGFLRGPFVHRKKGESYQDFRDRVKVEAQSIVALYNCIPALRNQILELQMRVVELEERTRDE